MKKSFKIYGRNGHRQAVSFQKGYSFVDWKGVKTTLHTADELNTNDYVIVDFEAENENIINEALHGQLSDGIFENYNYGKVEENCVISNGYYPKCKYVNGMELSSIGI